MTIIIREMLVCGNNSLRANTLNKFLKVRITSFRSIQESVAISLVIVTKILLSINDCTKQNAE